MAICAGAGAELGGAVLEGNVGILPGYPFGVLELGAAHNCNFQVATVDARGGGH